jgi:hypothetical protein
LEDYCGKLKRAFADLDDCQETVPEARKVRVFMQGLRSPELQVARSQVIASKQYSTNVEDAMNYVKAYKNSLDSMKTTTRTCHPLRPMAEAGDVAMAEVVVAEAVAEAAVVEEEATMTGAGIKAEVDKRRQTICPGRSGTP